MVFPAACQVLGTVTQDLNLERPADPTSRLKVGMITVIATLPLLATMAAMRGALPPARVVVKPGEEGAIKVPSRRTIGMREAEAEAPEETGTATHQTTLYRRPVSHGGSTPQGTPRERQRIGSGSTGVGLGIRRVMVLVTGGERDFGTGIDKSSALLGLCMIFCLFVSFLLLTASVEFFCLNKDGWSPGMAVEWIHCKDLADSGSRRAHGREPLRDDGLAVVGGSYYRN